MMATFNTSDIDKFAFDFEELANLPDSVIEEMLKAEGEIIRRAQSEYARAMLQGPYNKRAVEKAPKVGKLKKTRNGRAIYVSFEGTQHKTRISEIAFINEFGKHNQPARQFIRTANEKHADEAVDAAAKVYDQYLTKKGF